MQSERMLGVALHLFVVEASCTYLPIPFQLPSRILPLTLRAKKRRYLSYPIFGVVIAPHPDTPIGQRTT
jgi:hypothetical protein